MRVKVIYAGMIMIVFMLSALSHADVPDVISYQGILLDSLDNPVTTTSSVVFTIYDDSLTGTTKWTESRSVTPDANGIFNILLGEQTSITAAVFAGPDRWLGVKVGGDPEMTPRTRLSSVGYSYRVSTVGGATGGTISGDVNIQSDLDVYGDVIARSQIGIGGPPYWDPMFGGPDLHINAGQDMGVVYLGGELDTIGSQVGHLYFLGDDGAYAGIAGEIINPGGGLFDPPEGALLFYTATGIPPMGSPYKEQMRIMHNGEVGIGTNNPSAWLHLHRTNAQAGSNAVLRMTNDVSGLGNGDGIELGFWTQSSPNAFIANKENGFLALGAGSGGACHLFIGSGGNVGIGVSSTDPINFKLDVRGTIGNNTTLYHSDIRWKKNVNDIPNVIDRVTQLRGVNFEWRCDEFENMNFPEGQKIGVIAQEVEKIFPELVNTAPDGYKSVEYANLVAVLIEATKEQQNTINRLEQQVTRLTQMMQAVMVQEQNDSEKDNKVILSSVQK